MGNANTKQHLERLREELEHLRDERDAHPEAVARALKLLPRIKKLERVNVSLLGSQQSPDGVIIMRGATDYSPEWSVDFHPEGTFELDCNFYGRSDTRYVKVLKAFGEIHVNKGRRRKRKDD